MKVSEQRLADKKIFENIPLEQRSRFRKKIVETQQLQGDQPKFFIKHYQNSQFFDYQGFKLNYHFLEEHKHPKSVLFFFHGMYFHANGSGYLTDVISKSSSTNVYALDFKNAGKSQGDCPGYYESVESLVDQAEKFIEFIMKKYDQKAKIFVSGESMGGMVTFKLCLRNPEKYCGAILLCPALRDCFQEMPFLKKVGRVMGYLFPKLKIVPQDFKGMNKYTNLEYIKKDEGRYLGYHPPGSAYCLLKELDTLSQHFKEMKTPYLCIQAGMDTAVDLFAPLDLEKEAPVKDKTTIYFKDMWHDILVEEEIEEISPIIAQWIKQRFLNQIVKFEK